MSINTYYDHWAPRAIPRDLHKVDNCLREFIEKLFQLVTAWEDEKKWIPYINPGHIVSITKFFENRAENVSTLATIINAPIWRILVSHPALVIIGMWAGGRPSLLLHYYKTHFSNEKATSSAYTFLHCRSTLQSRILLDTESNHFWEFSWLVKIESDGSAAMICQGNPVLPADIPGNLVLIVSCDFANLLGVLIMYKYNGQMMR